MVSTKQVIKENPPEKLFLTKGKGVHEDRLTSFEYALRDAGIAGTNIVLISSIFPPHAKMVSRAEGLKLINPGQVLFCIYSRNQTNEPHRLIQHLLVWHNQKIPTGTVIFLNMRHLAKMKKRQVIMQKILQRKCLHHHLESSLTWTSLGMKKENSGRSQARFTSP